MGGRVMRSDKSVRFLILDRNSFLAEVGSFYHTFKGNSLKCVFMTTL